MDGIQAGRGGAYILELLKYFDDVFQNTSHWYVQASTPFDPPLPISDSGDVLG